MRRSSSPISRHLATTFLGCAVIWGTCSSQANAASPEWIHHFGWAYGEFAYGISGDGLGNVFVAGLTANSFGQEDAYFGTISSTGTLVSTTQFGSGGPDDVALDVAADPRGIVYLVGFTGGGLNGPNAG